MVEERMQRDESVTMLPKWVSQGIKHFQNLNESLNSLQSFFTSKKLDDETSLNQSSAHVGQTVFSASLPRRQSFYTRLSAASSQPSSLNRRTQSETSLLIEYASPLSQVEPPSQFNLSENEHPRDQDSIPNPSRSQRPLHRALSSPALTPSQLSPLSALPAPSGVMKDTSSPLLSTTSSGDLCCRVCSSPLAHHAASDLEIVTKQYFWYK